MTNIREREEALFAEWRHNRTGFAADGAIDESAFLASRPRIMLIMKEVNDPDGALKDLREFVRNGGRPQTWDNVARWLIGIRRLPAEIAWKDIEKISLQQRVEELRSIVVMNLKKSPGSHTTNVNALHRAAEEDREFLSAQFNLYAADLVICCGRDVSQAFHAQVHGMQDCPWRQTSRGIWYHRLDSGAVVVSYAHPEARVADSLVFYGMVDAVSEIGV